MLDKYGYGLRRVKSCPYQVVLVYALRQFSLPECNSTDLLRVCMTFDK